MSTPRIIVVMGVSGCGKSTIGLELAQRLGWPFHDGDDFHSPANVSKMSNGVALDDDDRRPWLRAMRARLEQVDAEGSHAVLAASLLKQQYREQVLGGLANVRLVYLKVEADVVDQRLKERRRHFFGSGLLNSQLELLQEPVDAAVYPADAPAASIVAGILADLHET